MVAVEKFKKLISKIPSPLTWSTHSGKCMLFIYNIYYNFRKREEPVHYFSI